MVLGNENSHELGFGTEYEKFVLSQIITEIVQELGIESVCEYPPNNLMGDNNAVFDRSIVKTYRLTEYDESKKGAYDLVWNFCEIEQSDTPSNTIARMFMLTANYVLIILQNRRNPGVFLHMVFHFLTRRTWDHGKTELMSLDSMLKLLSDRAIVIRTGYFDVPWFLLDIYECGKYLRKLIPSAVGGHMLQLKESQFEKMPTWFKKRFAHHAYVLLARR